MVSKIISHLQVRLVSPIEIVWLQSSLKAAIQMTIEHKTLFISTLRKSPTSREKFYKEFINYGALLRFLKIICIVVPFPISDCTTLNLISLFYNSFS
jgi:hypothetical protein